MARNGAEVLKKKNTKLEAYLKRNLDADTFERIRASEACIVCSEKEDKAFKFVVLSDEWLYLSENPPKKLYQTVNLADIVSVDLVNDFPDFLSGAERENTQHIVIKYYTDTSGKNIKAPKKTNNGEKKGSSATMQQSLDVKGPVSEGARNSSVVRLQRSVRLTSRMSGPTLTEELNSLDISRAKNDELSPPTDQSKHKRSKSWKGHESAKESKNEKRRSSVTESMIMQTSTKSKKVVKKTKKLKSASTNDLQNVTPSTSFNLASTMLNRYSSSQYDQVEKKSRPLPNPADKWDSDGKLIDTRTKEPLRLTCSENGELKLDLHKLGDSEDDEDSEEEIELNAQDLGSLDVKSQNDVAVPDIFVEEAEDPLRVATINIYILNFSSPILMLIRCAWDNLLIRTTLLEDSDFLYRSTVFTARSSQIPNERLERLFCQMKTDLFHPGNSMDVLYDLVDELRTGVERNFTLKKYFWKTGEMFQFFVQQLQTYLPKSASMRDTDQGKDDLKEKRTVELMYMNLLAETLGMMFRETETLPSRVTFLWADGGKAVLDLLGLLTCHPEVPLPDVPKCKSSQFFLAKKDQFQSLTDFELDKQFQDFTDVSTSVLFELILIAHQANWGDSEGNFFNIGWVVKTLEQCNGTEEFLDRLVARCMRLVWPGRHKQLKPQQVVQLYHQLHVLQTLLDYSNILGKYIRSQYYEEFKYYVQTPVIVDKLPQHYSLRPQILRLLQEVMSSVLERKVILND